MTNEEIVYQIQNKIDVTANQERLWLKNKGMVYKIIKSKKVHDKYMEEDLAQQGFIGLINAANKYDQQGEASFICYATKFINGSIQRYLESVYDNFHIPQHTRKLLRRYALIKQEAATKGKILSREQIKSELGVKEHTMTRLENTIERMKKYSLNCSIGNDEDETLMDLVKSDVDFEEMVIHDQWEKDVHEALQIALDSLDDTTTEMIKCKYYLGFSCTHIGEIMNCSSMYVLSRIQRGFYKIRKEYGYDLASLLYGDELPENALNIFDEDEKTIQKELSEENYALFIV